MSETTSFTDPVFLARFGLYRANVIDYFLHPLNPFKSKTTTSNDVLAMQGTTIGLLMTQASFQQVVLTPKQAEEEYQRRLTRELGEQYELLPPSDPSFYTQPSALYTIRHVLRTSPTSIKILGIYYIVEGVIYKSPAVRSIMKANVARTLSCLAGATDSLSRCARYQPSLGYVWVFDDKETSPYELIQMHKKQKRRKIRDHRRPGERTAAEEEGIRATEALDQILVRLKRGHWAAAGKATPAAKTHGTTTTTFTSTPATPAAVAIATKTTTATVVKR